MPMGDALLTRASLLARLGNPHYTRLDAPATPEQKARLKRLSPEDVKASSLAGEPIVMVRTVASALSIKAVSADVGTAPPDQLAGAAKFPLPTIQVRVTA